MKAFVGITPEGDSKTYLEKLYDHISTTYDCFTKSDLHITVKALGDISHDALEKVVEELSNYRAESFEVRLGRFGFFEGNRNNENGIFLEAYSPELKQVHNDLFELLGQYSTIESRWELERYNPHMSMGVEGLKLDKLKQARRELSDLDVNIILNVGYLRLFTKSDDAKYSELCRFRLQ